MKTKGSKPPRIEDRPTYVEEREKLDRAKSGLEAALDQLKAVTRIRRNEKVEKYLNKYVNVLLGVAEDHFDRMALEAAAEGEITDRIAKTLNSLGVPVPLQDEYEKESVEEVNRARRAVELFKRAVVLQERRVLAEKKFAIAEVSDALRGDRERIARRVATASLDLISVVNEEKVFLEGLRAQDEALPAALPPGAFPILLHPDSAIARWLGQSLGLPETEIQRLLTGATFEDRKLGAVQ